MTPSTERHQLYPYTSVSDFEDQFSLWVHPLLARFRWILAALFKAHISPSSSRRCSRTAGARRSTKLSSGSVQSRGTRRRGVQGVSVWDTLAVKARCQLSNTFCRQVSQRGCWLAFTLVLGEQAVQQRTWAENTPSFQPCQTHFGVAFCSGSVP